MKHQCIKTYDTVTNELKVGCNCQSNKDNRMKFTRYFLRVKTLQNSKFLTNMNLTCNQNKHRGPLQHTYLEKQRGSAKDSVFTVHWIPARKPCRKGLLLTQKNGDFGAIL